MKKMDEIATNRVTKRMVELIDNRRWRALVDELEFGMTELTFNRISDIDSFIATAYQVNAKMPEYKVSLRRCYKDLTVKILLMPQEYEQSV